MDVAWTLLAHVNASKVVAGVASMAFNFGSRALIGELTPAQQSIFQSPAVKRVVVWCMFFIVTRDILVSAALALVTIVALETLLNEHSRFCLLPGTRGHRSAVAAMPAALPAAHVVSPMVHAAAKGAASKFASLTERVNPARTF